MAVKIVILPSHQGNALTIAKMGLLSVKEIRRIATFLQLTDGTRWRTWYQEKIWLATEWLLVMENCT